MIFVKISGSFTGKVYAGTEDTISVAHHVDSLPEDIMEPENYRRPRKLWDCSSQWGLMTPERDHRHGRKKGKILRSCGEAEPDVIHISWKCKQFQQLRSQALALPKALLILGLLFASNMPPSCPLIQSTLATIWQRRMRSVFHQIHPIQKVHMRWLNTNQLRAAKGFFF